MQCQVCGEHGALITHTLAVHQDHQPLLYSALSKLPAIYGRSVNRMEDIVAGVKGTPAPPEALPYPVRDHTLHEDLISILVMRLHPKHYLELGCGNNETLEKVMALRHDATIVTAVDINEPPRRLENVHYHIKKTGEFIASLDPAERFDFVFIDADHSATAVAEDLKGILPHVTDHGLILLHDTWPASIEDTGPGWCGDGWKVAANIPKIASGIEAMTMPFHPGLTFIRKRSRHLWWDSP